MLDVDEAGSTNHAAGSESEDSYGGGMDEGGGQTCPETSESEASHRGQLELSPSETSGGLLLPHAPPGRRGGKSHYRPLSLALAGDHDNPDSTWTIVLSPAKSAVFARRRAGRAAGGILPTLTITLILILALTLNP